MPAKLLRDLSLSTLQELIGEALRELRDRCQPAKGEPDRITFHVVPPHSLCGPGERVKVVVTFEREPLPAD
jgi:hypothetical protein